MALHDHSDQANLMDLFGYQSDDLIDPSVAAAYEFCSERGGTRVRDVDRTDEGFVVPSLNETLLALAKETYALRGRLDA